VSSVRIYHPVTTKGLLGWEVARAAARVGGFRFLPGSASIPEQVTALLDAHHIGYRCLALARANHPSRYLALVLDDSFACSAVAKLAFDEAGQAALNGEAEGIRKATSVLTGAVRTPRLDKEAPGLLILEPVDWLPRLASWRLPGEVAHSLGRYSRLEDHPHGTSGVPAHGDFAPWNLLRTKRGWVLLDWEHSSLNKPPFFDLWHYLVQSHSLLGRPSERAVLDGLSGRRGWVKTAIAEYARGLGRSAEDAPGFFDDYIEASAPQLAGKSHREREGLDARSHLRQSISRWQTRRPAAGSKG
jgi:hypothetical protein